MKSILLNSILLFSFTNILFSQENKRNASPIPIETMFGNKKVNYLSILNVRFREDSRFSYFGVMTISTPYHDENGYNELVFSNAITYRLKTKLFVTSGLQYHFLKGIVPYFGLQYLFANPKWLFVLSPSIALLPNTAFQSVSILEYKPKLSKKLRLYTRFQGIYNFNLENGLHERSLVYLRTGLTIKRTSLGFGFNLDFYSPSISKQQNLGIFLHHLL